MLVGASDIVDAPPAKSRHRDLRGPWERTFVLVAGSLRGTKGVTAPHVYLTSTVTIHISTSSSRAVEERD